MFEKLSLIAICVFLFSGCFKKAKLKPPPNFTESVKDLESSKKEIEDYSETINRELKALKSGIRDLERLESRFPDSFPKEHFKHALMACLNTTKINEENSQYTSSAKRLGVTCEILPVNSLSDSLVLEKDLLVARKGMVTLDTIRQRRFGIQSILHEIPKSVSGIKSRINFRKSELRRLKSTLNRKRNEYSVEEWNASAEAIRGFESELNSVWDKTRTLTLNKKLWVTILGTENDILYKQIATLGE